MAHLRAPGGIAPVGMILCSDREKTKVEYATSGLSNKVFVSRYLTVLPSPELLSEFLRRDRERIGAGMLQKPLPGESTSKKKRTSVRKPPAAPKRKR